MMPIRFKTPILCLLLVYSSVAQAQNTLLQSSKELAKEYVIKDTLFKVPFIDVDEWREKPVKHRYVHGGFEGTEARFSFYFPSKEQYKGHFFQYITPFPDNENLSQGASGEEDKIGFSVSHGAYFIETNGGGRFDFTGQKKAGDPLIGAYKANAAAAQFSKTVANHIFGTHRTYGYAFGGSGGAYRTLGGIENTEGVWDGAVPYVVGSPMAIPNVFSVRMHAMRILNDKFPQIIDALEPGGSGDMYAGLNEEEKAALTEVTKMGFPPKSWFGYKTMGVHGFRAIYSGMTMADRSYFQNFWTKEGYYGSKPPASLLKARLQKVSKIKKGIPYAEAVDAKLVEPMSEQEKGTAEAAWKSLGNSEGTLPVAFQLEDIMPNVNFLGGDLLIKTGEAAGKTIQLIANEGDKVVLGATDPRLLAQLKQGDEVVVDNSNFLAAQTYHRHQVPSKEYKVWDQFRNEKGEPLYPQGPFLLGPMFTRGASGALPTGKFKGKMIMLESLWDREAFPWQADWYRSKVIENLGEKTNDHFRLWFTDRALHGDLTQQEDPTRTVSYIGVLQQALLDLSDWVEKGIDPAPSTSYEVVDGQVVVPETANKRAGIQPIVNLKVNGDKRVAIKAGQTVTFTAVVEVPPHTGKVVSAEWDFEGAGTFSVSQKTISFNEKNGQASLKTTYKFSKSGTYFPTLRVASQREGDAKTPYTRIQNLDRVRVVVK
ncbi:hypothetical protein [Runella sp.]|jgi:hypothetical protein|uniref:PKD domain-containing protein n=1 Tax=Runella sp. TaxID=1960881 RepID=UPI002618F0D3|nr:hypothetical protein [Runella sp.]